VEADTRQFFHLGRRRQASGLGFLFPNNNGNMMLELSNKWAPILLAQPETGMGYQVATVVLKDGSRIDKVTIAGGVIIDVAGTPKVNFKEEDIEDIHVTHDK